MGASDRCGERGAALLVALMAIVLLTALGSALVMTTSTDLLIAANAGASGETLYAAHAALGQAVAELRAAPDLSVVLAGAWTPHVVDGAPSGVRTLADGTRIDLGQIVNRANCGRTIACSATDLDVVARFRPWGSRNPRWRLFGYGPLDGRTSLGSRGMPLYVVTMVADDPAETDGDPARDGVQLAAVVNPGAGIIAVRAEAYGRRGSHRVLEGFVLRPDLQVLARWNAASPALRGPAPAGLAQVQLLASWEVR